MSFKNEMSQSCKSHDASCSCSNSHARPISSQSDWMRFKHSWAISTSSFNSPSQLSGWHIHCGDMDQERWDAMFTHKVTNNLASTSCSLCADSELGFASRQSLFTTQGSQKFAKIFDTTMVTLFVDQWACWRMFFCLSWVWFKTSRWASRSGFSAK